ncbi:unnamed protein product [Phytophthora lilii]|uniref:Unnamed protein product n=1 Tax=Phytophthora lilii TaxID=2077276 RepID=A0A9W6U4J2_9STRA|nr:unnamed protein product [Phytophthora lilii]
MTFRQQLKQPQQTALPLQATLRRQLESVHAYLHELTEQLGARRQDGRAALSEAPRQAITRSEDSAPASINTSSRTSRVTTEFDGADDELSADARLDTPCEPERAWATWSSTATAADKGLHDPSGDEDSTPAAAGEDDVPTASEDDGAVLTAGAAARAG